MDQNTYFELGVKLAFQYAGFSKEAGILSALKALFKRTPPAKGSLAAWRKTPRAQQLMAQRSATQTSAYGKFRQGGSLAKKRPRVA